jgi:hypothetical protein
VQLFGVSRNYILEMFPVQKRFLYFIEEFVRKPLMKRETRVSRCSLPHLGQQSKTSSGPRTPLFGATIFVQPHLRQV